jgi:DNA-repair protein complementing XP-A cells
MPNTRQSTPPRATDPSKAAASPPTPEATRRIEENRLRAKALREAHETKQREAGVPSLNRTPSGFIATDQIHLPNTRKRAHDAITQNIRETPATSRNGRTGGTAASKDNDDSSIRPARKFTKFVDYDFDKITDTKGGFLAAEDDPWNKAMSGSSAIGNGKPGEKDKQPGEQRPEGMSASEWERLQILRKLRKQKAGPFEPGMSVLIEHSERKKCRECGSLEIDFMWEEVFGCAVCNKCKESMPEKYSLLTKTECREDYLLTERKYCLLATSPLRSNELIGFGHSRTERRATLATSIKTEPAQVTLARHDALPPVSSGRVRIQRQEMGFCRSA